MQVRGARTKRILGGRPVQHHAFGATVEGGGDLQTATDGVEVPREQFDCRDRTVLDMADPRLRHTHPLGHIDLAQPSPLGPLALLN
jgi:hypothetical protein